MEDSQVTDEFDDYNAEQLEFVLQYELASLYMPQQYELVQQKIKFAKCYPHEVFRAPLAIATQLMLPKMYRVPINMQTNNFKQQFFEVLEIGKGAFGKVFRAKFRKDDKVYAIKRLAPSDSFCESATDEVLSEVRILSRLVNDFVVRYYDAWIEYDDATCGDSTEASESGGICENNASFGTLNFAANEVYTYGYYDSQYGCTECTSSSSHESRETSTCGTGSVAPAERRVIYIQMEYCDGKSLSNYLNDGKLSEREKWKITIDLLLGLQYIHSQKILHHDIKPENIFMTRDLSIKYGDFGIACSVGERFWKRTGTYDYMPPESLENIKLDFRDMCKRDVYALGITLLRLWQSNLDPALRQMNASKNVQILAANVPYPELSKVLRGMTERDYKQRFSLAEVLKSPIILEHIENAEAFVMSYCANFKQEPTNIDKLKEMVSLLLSEKRHITSYEYAAVRDFDYIQRTQDLFNEQYTPWDTVLNYHECKEIQFLGQHLQPRYIIHKDLYLLVDICDLPVLYSLQHHIKQNWSLYIAIYDKKQYPAQVFTLNDNLVEVFLYIKNSIINYLKANRFLEILVDNSKRKFKLESKQIAFAMLPSQLRETYVWSGFEVFGFVVEVDRNVLAFGGVIQNYLEVLYLFD